MKKKFILYIIGFILTTVIIMYIWLDMTKSQRSMYPIISGIAIGTLVASIYWGIKLFSLKGEEVAKKVIKGELKSVNDFDELKPYYRDLIKDLSPEELVYVYNLDFDYQKTLKLGLLNLYQEGYINISDNKITITNKDKTDINKIDLFILKNIKNSNIYLKPKQLEEIIYKDGIIKELIVKNDKYSFLNTLSEYRFTIMEWISLLFIILFLIFLVIAYQSHSFVLIYIPVFLLGLSFISLAIISGFLNTYERFKNKRYIRTDKANEIVSKLDSLKLFLKDFSSLSEKETKEVKQWNDYLIYSVMFDLNNKISKELDNYILD